MFIINLLKDNYFSETNSVGGDENIDDFKNLTIKSITSLENICDFNNDNLDIEKKNNDYVITEEHSINNKTNSNSTSLYNEKEYIEIGTQTDDDSSFNLLKQENEILRIKNVNLERNMKELTSLVSDYMKLNVDNIDIEYLRNKMTILLNRELRMNYPMPFSSILSKYSK